MRSFLKYNFNALVWAFFILVLLFMPISGVEHGGFSFLDKLIHTFFFSVLCYLSITGRLRQLRFSHRKGRVPLECLIFCVVFGVITEVIQYFLKYRSFDTWDMLANSAGAFMGFSYFELWIKPGLKYSEDPT